MKIIATKTGLVIWVQKAITKNLMKNCQNIWLNISVYTRVKTPWQLASDVCLFYFLNLPCWCLGTEPRIKNYVK